MERSVGENGEGIRWAVGCAGQLCIAILGVVVSMGIAFWQTNQGREQVQLAAANAHAIADQQNKLTIQLDEIAQWRIEPKLAVLAKYRVRRDTMNCVIQNTGGRDLVLFSVELELTTPLTEIKGGPPASELISRPVIESADRSKVETIDLAMKNLDRDSSFILDPATIVKPGESLTLKFIFPTPSKRHIVRVRSNNVDPNSGESDQGLSYLFHFEPAI
jgi:hypothetical protein